MSRERQDLLFIGTDALHRLDQIYDLEPGGLSRETQVQAAVWLLKRGGDSEVLAMLGLEGVETEARRRSDDEE